MCPILQLSGNNLRIGWAQSVGAACVEARVRDEYFFLPTRTLLYTYAHMKLYKML